MQIAFITKTDIPIIKSYLEKLYLELGEEKESINFLSEELIQNMIGDGKTIILKAIDNHTIKGILTLTESQAIYSGGAFGSIDEMYVLPEYRSQNVGAILIKKAVEIAKKKGWHRIDVTAPTSENPATVAFYEKNGFCFTGPKLKLTIN